MEKFIQFNQLDHTYLDTQLDLQIKQTVQLINHLEQISPSSWQTIMLPLNRELYKLNKLWGIVGHLQSVKDSPELRQLHDKFLPLITELYVNLGQNQKLYQHIKAIKEIEYPNLNPEQQKIIDNELRDFKLSGITLNQEDQQKFKELQTSLSELSTKFEHNVLDATDSYSKYVTLAELSGVPNDSIALYKAMAKEEHPEKYKLTLHMPSYLPILQFANNRALREELYKEYVTRASEFGASKFDNSEIIRQIIRIRQQKAQLLDFSNYAELSLFNKMAESPQQVLNFLFDLAQKARSFAEKDLSELQTFAKETDGLTKLEAWDIPYYSEKLQQHKYSYSSNELKQYFPLPNVFNGLFTLIKNLYQLEFKINPQIPSWHDDVTAYDVIIDGKVNGYLYFDLYARDGKQPGAWMNSAQDRNLDDKELQLPMAYIICNFSKPVADKPSLLTFDEVQTLFHEMGHALHHLLTIINNSAIAGINGVEWDAVELPSQFMENFAWDYNILCDLTAHIETNEVLPKELYNKVLASRYYQSGLQTLRQIEFAVFDLLLHSEFDYIHGNYLEQLNRVRKQIAVITPPEYNRFANSFSHIFAGGYAAGYYSYKWAEVLACDIFSVFDGVPANKLGIIGDKFRTTILNQGGLRPMMENFKAFMGREPQIEALLKYSGMN